MQGKISVKIGSFEVSCEGETAFIESTLASSLESVRDIYLALGLPKSSADMGDHVDPAVPSGGPAVNLSPLSVSTICAKLKVDSGPTLIMAACFSLQRRGTGSCTRRQLTDEMRAATSYFKSSYISNLSASLKSLVSAGKLLEQAKDVFAIDAATLSSLESQLGLS